MDRDAFIKFIMDRRWQFAKTMPKNPHEYTMKKWGENESFNQAVLYIRQCGYRECFGKYYYTYLDIDGYKYWTMGAPIEQTILINRAKI